MALSDYVGFFKLFAEFVAFVTNSEQISGFICSLFVTKATNSANNLKNPT
jgi:hypothetical protein